MQVFRKIKFTRNKVLIIIFTLIFLSVFCLVNNKWLTVTDYSYSSDRLPQEFDGFKIVHISDLHNASFGKNNARLIDKIKRCEPDIIVITGDIADGNRPDIGVSVRFCEEAAKLCPTYYVTGNHEYALDCDEFAELSKGIENSGAVFLQNETTQINVGESSLTLVGLNDNSLCREDLAKIMENVSPDSFTILLAHEPQEFEEYCACSPDLIFCGHAHGGQVRLPFVGGLVAPDQGFFPKYTEGRFDQDQTTMYISRGLGNSVIPLRVFDLPEIVCVSFQK